MTTAERGLPIAGVAESTSERVRTWALVSLILYVINGIAFAGFSASGGIWFTISDSVGLLLAVSLIVLVVGFDNLFRPLFGRTSLMARWVGVVAMSLGIAGSIVLLSSQTGHDFVPGEGGLGMQFAGWGLLGVWFLMIAYMGSRGGQFTGRWTWAARVAGLGSILAMAGTIPLGPESPIVSIGFTATFVAIVLWVVWTRKELASI